MQPTSVTEPFWQNILADFFVKLKARLLKRIKALIKAKSGHALHLIVKASV